MDIKHSDEDPIYFDNFEEKDLKNIIDTQEGIIKYMKEKEYKHLYNICIIIDDWADNERVGTLHERQTLVYLYLHHFTVLHTNITGGKKECHATIHIQTSQSKGFGGNIG